MDCPDCGGPVETYALAGHEAAVCGACGRVGIEADHTGEPRDPESWSEALDRFRGARDGGDPAEADADAGTAADAPGNEDGSEGTDADGDADADADGCG